MITRRLYPNSWTLILLLLLAIYPSKNGQSQELRDQWIGFTAFRTNLPGGRHNNVRTMRACIIRADGKEFRELVPELIDKENTWTQMAGWSPDGRQAIIAKGWEDPANAAWEEEHKTFRFNAESWSLDIYLHEFQTNSVVNLSAIERVSYYNGGLFFWPGQPDRLGFTALIDGNSHPFSMNRDGTNKRDLTGNSKEFSYGFSSSPDGKHIAYHKNYQIVIADADGSAARTIDTGNPFNFAPTWSPTGQWLTFVSGEHYNCHPYIVRSDGTELRKLADRNGYRGVTEFLDVPDYHGGSSDVPCWSVDGSAIYFTSQQGENVELCRASLDGTLEVLTKSPPGSTHYHPASSPDGQWLLCGTKRHGARQVMLLRLSDRKEFILTSMTFGQAAMWPHWRPTVAP